MLAVIDYEVGNLGSVYKAFRYLGAPVSLTKDPAELQKASGLILPGVGAFAEGAANLRRLGLESIIRERLQKGTPFLGICLGLQLLFETSEENAGSDRLAIGLGLCRGAVRRFPAGLKVPQIGWNELKFTRPSPLFAGLQSGCHVYFLHSYYAAPADCRLVVATTDYGIDYCSAIELDNIYAVQFHPEKSGEVGLAILRNFCAICS
ncbi:MAG TPA: imidazole glycerol phosphate synthase subunit HisH [Firmicutes bacterium]|nr:imidazole glycerol phosphate synthase subunit HisH [Bacillota bacterium]